MLIIWLRLMLMSKLNTVLVACSGCLITCMANCDLSIYHVDVF